MPGPRSKRIDELEIGSDDLETWKNPNEGRVWINRIDHRGELSKDEIIGPGKVFHMSALERRLNQEMASDPDLDIFTNGTLSPVRLIEGSADAEAFKSNPNLMTEGDMKDLFKPAKTEAAKAEATDAFTTRLTAIKNPATLDRLLSLARTEDAPLSRVEAIENRIREIAGVQSASVDTRSSLSGRPAAAKAVTPS